MDEIEKLELGIAALENQRSTLGDSIVEAALGPLRERLTLLRAQRQPEQQRKLVTTLFADISGFTALSEKVDAEDVRDAMNAVWERLDGGILAFGGRIDKHLGDGVMAVWGVEEAREDDPERAVRAALAMQHVLTLPQPGLVDASLWASLKVRIGINTGLAMLGALGTLGEYTAVGDAVNVAARLENAAPPGGILISYDTYRHVRGIFDVSEMPPLLLKGKSEPVQTYLVHAARPRAFRLGTRGVEGIETHMIGREAELERLKQVVQDAVAGHPLQMVLVSGDAGLGKSRLLYELEKWNDTFPGEMWVFKSRADQQRQDLPYSLARDLFFYRFDILESDSQAEARRKLEDGVSAFGVEQAEQDAHFLGQLLGLDYADSPHIRAVHADARLLRERAYQAAMNLFAAAAAQAPLLFLVEDLHWADDESLDLMLRFRQQFADSSTALIITARTAIFERFPEWQASLPFSLHLSLQPLSLDQTRLLVHDILRKMEDLPLHLRETIVRNAEGNPFFVEELVKMLIETGAIVKGQDRWRVDPDHLETVQVPPTLTGVLQSRLDRLQPPEKAVLHRASVVGRIFWDDAVAHLSEADGERLAVPEAVPAALQSLKAKELVFSRIQSAFVGSQEYVFKNALLRDVTYEQVLKTQRRIYHQQAAEWLIAKGGDRVNEFAPLVAEHYERAGEAQLAAEWYLRSARAAQDAYALEMVVEHCQNALALMAGAAAPAWRLAVHERMGSALYQLARSADALQAFQAMLEAARACADVPATLRALHGLAFVHEFQGNYADVIRNAQATRAVLESAGIQDRAEFAQTLLEEARAHYYRGHYPEARLAAEQGLEFAVQSGAQGQMARLYNVLGMVYTAGGDYPRAIEFKTRSLEAWRSAGNRLYEAAMLSNLGENYRVMGEYAQAIAYYEQSLSIATELHDIGQAVVTLNNMGGAYVGQGDYEAAVASLERVFELSRERTFTDAETFSFLAEARLGLGQIDRALDAARRAIAICLGGEESAFGANAWRVLALVACRLGRPLTLDLPEGRRTFAASECFERSLGIARQTGVLRDQAATLIDWSRALLRDGATDEARTRWLEARTIFETLQLPRFLEQMAREHPDFK